MAEKKNCRRGKLLKKYTAKMLYSWDDGKFEDKYLRKLERILENWKEKTIWGRRASSPRVGTLKGK